MTDPVTPIYFTPSLMTDRDLASAFLTRKPELQQVIGQVRAAPADDAPQHLLILGKRGMGKTMLLHRVARQVNNSPKLRAEWLPIVFQEHQRNIGELADLWINALEAVAGNPKLKLSREQITNQLKDHEGPALEATARQILCQHLKSLGRRALLLIDNFDGVLARIDPDIESSKLREVLQEEPSLMIIGTSCKAIPATYEYDRPFYQMFHTIELSPLSLGECGDLLGGLAALHAVSRVTKKRMAHLPTIGNIHGWTEGTPRTLTMFFEAMHLNPRQDDLALLQAVLDRQTDFYRSQLDGLSLQAQRIFVSIAKETRSSSVAEIAETLRLPRSVVSGQVHRLVDRELLERIDTSTRSHSFWVTEHLFLLWCRLQAGQDLSFASETKP